MYEKRIVSINMLSKDNKKLTDILEEFLLYKKSQGNCCERTEKDYRYHIKKLLEDSEDILIEKSLESGIIRNFAKLNNKSAVTYNMRYKYLNCFFNWCTENDYLSYNPLKKLKLKKRKENSRAKDIKIDILKDLLNIIDLKTYYGLRNYTIIIISLDCGIRPNELLRTEIKDYNFYTNELKVRKEISKTSQERILPLSPFVVDTIKKLISVTPKDWKGNFIFYTIDGNLLSSSIWSKIMLRYSKQLGYDISAYNLRHAFAINYLRNGGNIFSLQRIMGHSNLSMTQRYLALSQVDIIQQHKIATPINDLIKRNTKIINLFKERK